MAIGIEVVREDLETLHVQIHLTGLTVGTRYDVMRLQLRYVGKDDTGQRIYQREIPDRRALWSSVAHRVGWQAPKTEVLFRDFETPMRPVQYYLCRTDAIGPHEWLFSDGDYPTSKGVLATDIVHFNGDLADANLDEEPDEGHILVRSVEELAHRADCCLVEMDGPRYTARATEFAVLGSQYPVIVADSREARRGSVTLLTKNIGQLNDLRRVVYPESGLIQPFIMNSGGDATLLLDDMRVIPMDVSLEQVTPASADARYVRIDYVEVDNSAPLLQRIGDNDDLIDQPEAAFSFSDTTPAKHQWITITDHSTGQGDTWEFTLERGYETDNKVAKFWGPGPHRVYWGARGKKTVKLRFGSRATGFHTRTKYITVH